MDGWAELSLLWSTWPCFLEVQVLCRTFQHLRKRRESGVKVLGGVGDADVPSAEGAVE